MGIYSKSRTPSKLEILKIRSGKQRFYEGIVNFKFPMLFSGIADVCEWYDERTEKYRIKVEAKNKVWGHLFGYHGTFDAEYIDIKPEEIPFDVKPIREEIRK